MSWKAGAVLAGLLLASCGTSPPTHYFALTAEPATAGEARPMSFPVTVAAVRIPPSLDRREMVRSGAGTEMEISGQDRWTAPLGDMTRNVLSQDLASRLTANQVIMPGSPIPPGTAEIVVSLTRFGPDAHGNAVMAGDWSVVEPGRSQPSLRRAFTLRSPAPSAEGGAQAAAMSRLAGMLASQMAETLAESHPVPPSSAR